MSLTVEPVTGEERRRLLPDLAQLRIEIFRAFPYLYDGDLDYEERYLRDFAASEGAVLVAARDGDTLVGAATASPMAEHADEFAKPFRAQGYDIGRIFYLAESVLKPEYRGQGIGHAFFDHREAHAREKGYERAAFCAVIRPDDHPMRPDDYQPLDPFWRKRGYEPVEGLTASFPWKDIGDDKETEKRMQFWMRDL